MAKYKTTKKRRKATSVRTNASPRTRPKQSSRKTLRLYRGIGTCLTLEGAALKEGRRPQESDLSLIRRAAILEEDGRVAWVGPEAKLPKSRVAGFRVEEVDFDGRCVMPAFVECHTHLVFAGDRADEFEARIRGASYQEIAQRGGGILSTVRATRASSREELVRLAQGRADRFVRQGVTTLECKSGYGLTSEAEFKMLDAARRIQGPRLVPTYLGPHAIPPEAGSAEAYLNRIIDEDLPRLERGGHACRVDIFVEEGYFPKALARRYLEAARAHGLDIVVHADQLTRSGGAQLAVEFGARSAEHLIQINDADIRALAASETTAVLLPAADLYLRCAYPPARALLDAGARVALATDFNPGSSPTQSLSLVGVLSRLEMKMSLPEVLVAYTLGGAYALGLGRELGALVPGRACDLIALETDWTQLFYSIGEMPVDQVWREGCRLATGAPKT